MLRDSGYAVQTYDPFFDPVPERLGHRYDFIVACEVIEHLFDPHAELLTLRGLLRDGGVLALMTALWTPDVDFASWHYCRDPAHVAFYSRATFGWIADRFDFRAHVFVPPRVVALRA